MKLNVRVAGDRLARAGVLLTASLLVLLAGVLLFLGRPAGIPAISAGNGGSPWLQRTWPTAAVGGAKGTSQIAFAHLPLSFEANQGQTDAAVKFLARGGGYTLFLTQNEAVLKLPLRKRQSSSGDGHSSRKSVSRTGPSASGESVVRMHLVGADVRAHISGSDQLLSRSNYLTGNNPSQWRRNVPQYARVRYHHVYPGVDLVYYGNQGRLEYDFEVAPGADPGQIALKIDGAQKLRVDHDGNLLAQTVAGDVQLNAPEVYQTIAHQKRPVAGKFILSSDNRVGFALGEYDRSRALVIDPVLNYSTYLGGSLDEGCAFLSGTYTTAVAGCPAIAADTAGNIYVAGTTTSTAGFPVAGTPFQGSASTPPDAFISKFQPNASSVYSLVYSTYLGGNGSDTSAGIAVDSSSNIYVALNTSSTDLTVVKGRSSAPSTGSHVYVAVLNAPGNTLLYSTYLFGDGTDTATGLAIDTQAKAYVTGTTTSTTFPTTPGAFQVNSPSPGNPEFFLSELSTMSATNTGDSSLTYSTYFGGAHAATTVFAQGGGVAVNPLGSGVVYISGGTNYTDLPVLNAYRACLDDPANTTPCSSTVTSPDAFVAKFDTNAASGAQLKYSTYFGGTQSDVAYGVAVDSGGNAYIAGSTSSNDLPIASTTNAFQASNAGGTDAFVAKFGPSGTPIPLSYSSYLGGTGNDIAYAIAVDVNQGTHVAGFTDSPASALNSGFNVNAIQGSPSTLPDAFVALLQTTSAGQTGGYATYLGGSGNDDATGIAVDSNSNTYTAGETSSADFPLANAQFGTLTGPSDAFIAKIAPAVTGLTMTASTSITSGTAGIGNQVTFTYTIKNTGPDLASNLLFSTTLPGTGATFGSATATPGSCTAVVNGTVTCSLGSLGVGTSTQATVKINLTPTAAGALTNSGTLQANGTAITTQSATVTVSDFRVGISPATTTVLAGNSATYQATVGVPAGQTGFDPNQISLSCSAGVPAGAACTFSTSPVTLTNTSPVSSTLTITTTARPVTTGSFRDSRVWYAAILPITGLTFLGIGMGGSRRRNWVGAIFALLIFGLAGFQLACGSGSGTSTPPTGTPAGTYAITVAGTSGSVSHAVRMTLVVQ